jgi:hypothetical protein
MWGAPAIAVPHLRRTAESILDGDRLDVCDNECLTGGFNGARCSPLAASPVVRRGRLRRMREEDQATRRGNSREMNLLDVENACATLTRLAAIRCSSRGTRPSQSVERTADAEPAAVQYVQVRHRRGHVRMAQQLLHSANVMPVLEQVCRK